MERKCCRDLLTPMLRIMALFRWSGGVLREIRRFGMVLANGTAATLIFMKSLYSSAVAALAVLVLLPATASAAVSVDFSGGAGAPLSFTLPAMSWQITNAADFNLDNVFGIGIALGQHAQTLSSGTSAAGDPADWSSTGTLDITLPSFTASFYETSLLYGGGIIWFGLGSNQQAQNNDIVTFSGGTLGTNGPISGTFADGSYDIYLIDGWNGEAVSAPGIAAVPEASTALLGVFGLALAARRRRR